MTTNHKAIKNAPFRSKSLVP